MFLNRALFHIQSLHFVCAYLNVLFLFFFLTFGLFKIVCIVKAGRFLNKHNGVKKEGKMESDVVFYIEGKKTNSTKFRTQNACAFRLLTCNKISKQSQTMSTGTADVNQKVK